MNADLNVLRALARVFYQTELEPYIDKFTEQHQVDRQLWNKAGELGLLRLSIPGEYGARLGSGAAHRWARATRIVARHCSEKALMPG